MPNLRPPLIIALDGPAASGKSTVAIRIAEKMDIFYINTGYMYRAVALRCMQKGVSHDADIAKIKEVVENIKFEIKEKRIMVDGQDISKEVASVEVENKVSYFASLKAVREVLIKKQRQLANEHSVILDGRDIGTVVFPKAQIKIFLSATPQTRAKRRYEELKQKFPDKTLNYEEIR